ncbi:MAG: alpha/beta hydrolase [Gammaproteobacteria bacterium]
MAMCFSSGESLISLAFGLHDLEVTTKDQKTLLIGVHGSNSRGYEWIYPLQVLDKESNLISFFRWNDKGCPKPSVTSLLDTIRSKIDDNPHLERVILLGHSYGGLLVTAFSEAWDLELPLEIHSIASPLKGMRGLSSICEYQPPDSLPAEMQLHQWRTIQELDGAFRNLDYDPQEVEIKNSTVTRLPETYKGNKLGHNWSISWVADELNKS